MKIQSKKLGLACALTGILFYIGCAGLMLILGQSGTVWFFNSILHGFDVSTVIRMNVPVEDALAGFVLTAFLAGFSGWTAATIYNKLIEKSTD